MESLKDILKQNGKGKDSIIAQIQDKHKYVTQEYQDFGYRIAMALGDKKKAPIFIKWAKEKPRVLLETALNFTSDYPNAKSKVRIFMWKVRELEQAFYDARPELKEHMEGKLQKAKAKKKSQVKQKA